jgi:CheY-like chemotaxis protein
VANSHIPIIFITAHEDDAQRAQALEAGAVAFLHKPFYEEQLLNAIDAALKDS